MSAPAHKLVLKTTFEGSATRTTQPWRMDLIPGALMRAVGRRMKMGVERHGENNWLSGGDTFRKETASHLIAHLFEYLSAGRIEDLDAVAANVGFLCHFQETIPLKPPTFSAPEPESTPETRHHVRHQDLDDCKPNRFKDTLL